MAAPPSKTLKDFSGKWVMNKQLSDSPDPVLALQGVGYLTRTAIGLATVTLHVKEFQAPPAEKPDSAPVTHVEISQTLTGGLKGSTENRTVDDAWREHADWLFGRVRGRTRWITPAEITDEFLAGNGGWLEGEGEKSGPAGETHLLNYVESLDNGWVAQQVWGFQVVEGERRYVRNVVVTKGDKRVAVRLVYDYLEDE